MPVTKIQGLTAKTVFYPSMGFVATVYKDGKPVYDGMAHSTRDKARRDALKDFQDLYSWGMIDTSTD